MGIFVDDPASLRLSNNEQCVLENVRLPQVLSFLDVLVDRRAIKYNWRGKDKRTYSVRVDGFWRRYTACTTCNVRSPLEPTSRFTFVVQQTNVLRANYNPTRQVRVTCKSVVLRSYTVPWPYDNCKIKQTRIQNFF